MPEAKKKAEPKAETVKVGDVVDLGGAGHYVRLPDGTVVTARSSYVVRHEGEHVAGDRVFIGEKG